jgi:hypothetical protein
MTMTMTKEWQWMRVYYFEQCKDHLILNAVWPAIRTACSSADASGFFQRKGVGGPNVLIGIRSGNLEDVERAREVIRAYLRKHPSSTCISHAEYDQICQTLASWEKQSDGLGLQENNELLDCPEPHNPLVKAGEFQEAIRSFLCRSASLVVNWLEMVEQGKYSRDSIALHAMLAVGWVANPHKLTSCVSFGSHVFGFLNKADKDQKLAAVFSRNYENGNGEALRHFVRTTIDAMERRETPIPFLDSWLQLLRETMTVIYQGLVSGTYEIASVMQFQYPEDQQALVSLLDESPSMRAWQITVNLVYLTLNQLGVRALERFYACYLLYRAVNDIYGGLAEIGPKLAMGRDTVDMLPFFASWEKATPQSHMKLYSIDAKA